MTAEETKQTLSRRGFMRRAGLGVAGAAGVTVVTWGATKASATEPRSGKRRVGYRETEHVRRVYDLSRF
jgi:nitrous oxide reductase